MNKPAGPLWIIVKNGTGHMEVLRIRLSAGGKALPIFSCEDEARVFLELGKFSGDWRVRETAAGELISILYCLCAGVDRLVLDPLPGSLAELNGLLSLRSGAFTKFASKSDIAGEFCSACGHTLRAAGSAPRHRLPGPVSPRMVADEAVFAPLMNSPAVSKAEQSPSDREDTES